MRIGVSLALCGALLSLHVSGGRTAAQTTITAPVLVSEPESTRALAIESVAYTREPFATTRAIPFGADARTRIVLFAMNLTLQPGESASAVMAEARDAAGRVYPLTVESVAVVPQQDWLSAISVRLHDELGAVGDVHVSLKYRGLTSNNVRLGVGRIGGSLTDTPGMRPTPGRGTKEIYLSDLPWLQAPNGNGPVERDRSSGGNLANDGRVMKLNNVIYTKGLGAHSDSRIIYRLNGEYERMLTDIGIDDESGNNGSVTFEIWADDEKLFDSGVMTGATQTRTASISLAGKRELVLRVTDAGDNNYNDHGDWANARLVRPIKVEPITGQQPFGKTAWAIPGKIEAEDFDEGGAGIAFADSTPGNIVSPTLKDVYRTGVDVDIEPLRDRAGNSDGGYSVSMNPAGEWTAYTVDVARAGRYNIEIRAASTGAGKVRLEFANGVKTPTITLPGTFTTNHFRRTTQPVTLAAGRQVMRLVTEGGDTPNRSGNIDYLRFRPMSPLLTREPGTGDIIRLLDQATFGATPELIQHVKEIGIEAFIEEQFSTASSGAAYGDEFFHQAVHAPDQLRQRVAFALSQILVVSNLTTQHERGSADYMRMLKASAFGNYRTLLTDVTLHPVMGQYLDMVNNRKPDPVAGSKANVNYARETLELFTVGLYKLNDDGTRQLDQTGNPVATYGEDEVAGAARAMTGWTYDVVTGTPQADNRKAYFLKPLVGFELYHDRDEKKMLGGSVLPPGLTIRQDLDATLDAIFAHPNVAPFISRQLIQHLVTSNPTPTYVARISAVFKDNGAGVRGDLRAVVRAILLDDEARGDTKTDPNFGRVREPAIFIANLLRAFNGETDGLGLPTVSEEMGQHVQNAPTVFNFYRPNTTLENSTVQCPQCEILTTANILTRYNFFNRIWRGNPLSTSNGRLATTIDFRWLEDLAATDADKLVEQLDLLLMAGQMPTAMRSAVLRTVAAIPASRANARVRTAAYLIVTSPHYQFAR